MSEDKKDFNELVNLAMADPALSAMRPVVEKELLHYEIFEALDAEGLLKDLVFQGGTALRLCRGSDRFSEDLDFAGGTNFSVEGMGPIKECLEKRIGERFGLKVDVSSKPPRVGEDDIPNIRLEKWWISIQTTPENRAMPRQRIKLEIANVPAHTRELVPLRANYNVRAGMPTVLVNTESLNEIMADKVLAFPTSLLDKIGQPVLPDSGKIRHRDIWDMAWMLTRGARLDSQLVAAKIADYRIENYASLLDQAIEQIPKIIKSREFTAQMTRFIDSVTANKTVANDAYLDYLTVTVGSLLNETKAMLSDMPRFVQ